VDAHWYSPYWAWARRRKGKEKGSTTTEWDIEPALQAARDLPVRHPAVWQILLLL